jgi:hypothetical protein
MRVTSDVEFTAKWGGQYPAIIRLWENAWSEFVPFLDHDVEIRRVICSTNVIESTSRPLMNTLYGGGCVCGHVSFDAVGDCLSDGACGLLWLLDTKRSNVDER